MMKILEALSAYVRWCCGVVAFLCRWVCLLFGFVFLFTPMSVWTIHDEITHVEFALSLGTVSLEK
jgi:hypothetical protein